MGKTKSFDAVKLMREIRDRMSREMRGMTPQQQIEYVQRKAAESRGKTRREAATRQRSTR